MPVISYADISTGLVGWWRFDEASGSVIDYSSTGATGTLSGGGGGSTRTQGKLGNGMNFNRANSQYVDLGVVPALNSTDITYTAWVKPASNLAQAAISNFFYVS